MRNDQSKKVFEIQLPFQSSDIQADPTQGESESFKKLLELVHTIENAMKSEIELRKLDKGGFQLVDLIITEPKSDMTC